MGEEDIQILIEEANKAGKQIFDEDDKEEWEHNKNNNIMKYKANKEEQEILEPYKDKYPSNLLFTNLISESIKFSYNKNPKTFKPKNNCEKVIEEEINIPQQADIVDTEGSNKRIILNENDKNEKSKANISEDNKNEYKRINRKYSN